MTRQRIPATRRSASQRRVPLSRRKPTVATRTARAAATGRATGTGTVEATGTGTATTDRPPYPHGMKTSRNPDTIAAPVGRYVHQIEVESPSKLLFIAG